MFILKTVSQNIVLHYAYMGFPVLYRGIHTQTHTYNTVLNIAYIYNQYLDNVYIFS